MEATVLIFKAKKSKLVWQAAFMAAALALSIWTMSNAEVVMQGELRIAVFLSAFITCVILSYFLLYHILLIWNAEPLLKADAEGLWFHGSQLYYGKVLWSEIAGYEVAQYGFSKRVLIKVKHPEVYAVKYQDLRKYAFKRMRKRYGTPVALPADLFADDVVDMLRQLSAYKPA